MPTSARIATIQRIQDIYKKLSAEALVVEELEELVRLTTDLHESAVILRYKAAEERVFDKTEIVEEIQQEEIPQIEPEVEEEPKEKPSTIDFSIFDQPTEEVLEEVHAEVKEKAEEIIEQKLDFTPEEEKEVVIPETIVANTPSVGGWNTYFDKVLKEHASGLQTPLASLAGSFGLNERILYINELFDKEAETFSDLIQKLDQIPDWPACTDVLSNEADSRDWDKENDTTGEFILHIKRRYV